MDFLPILGFVAYVIFKIFKVIAQTGEAGKAGKVNKPWENDRPWENDKTNKAGRPAIPLRRTKKRIAPATDLTPNYREQAVIPSVPASLEEQTNPWLELLVGDNLVQGMVLKEILQPPRALRPFSLQRR